MGENRAQPADQGGRYAIGMIACPQCSAPAGQPCRTNLAGLALAEDHRERVIAERDGYRADREALNDAVSRLRAENERLRAALTEIATRSTFERNPDGVDQAAFTMQLIANDALVSAGASDDNKAGGS